MYAAIYHPQDRNASKFLFTRPKDYNTYDKHCGQKSLNDILLLEKREMLKAWKEGKKKRKNASCHSHLPFKDASRYRHAHTHCSTGRSANRHHGVWQVDGHLSGRSHYRAGWGLGWQRWCHVQQGRACGFAWGILCCDGETSCIFIKDFWDGQSVNVTVHADLVILGD